MGGFCGRLASRLTFTSPLARQAHNVIVPLFRSLGRCQLSIEPTNFLLPPSPTACPPTDRHAQLTLSTQAKHTESETPFKPTHFLHWSRRTTVLNLETSPNETTDVAHVPSKCPGVLAIIIFPATPPFSSSVAFFRSSSFFFFFFSSSSHLPRPLWWMRARFQTRGCVAACKRRHRERLAPMRNADSRLRIITEFQQQLLVTRPGQSNQDRTGRQRNAPCPSAVELAHC